MIWNRQILTLCRSTSVILFCLEERNLTWEYTHSVSLINLWQYIFIGRDSQDLHITVMTLTTSAMPVINKYSFRTFPNESSLIKDVHLTNVAIQKTSENYDEKLGGKWLLQTLKLYLISKYPLLFYQMSLYSHENPYQCYIIPFSLE